MSSSITTTITPGNMTAESQTFLEENGYYIGAAVGGCALIALVTTVICCVTKKRETTPPPRDPERGKAAVSTSSGLPPVPPGTVYPKQQAKVTSDPRRARPNDYTQQQAKSRSPANTNTKEREKRKKSPEKAKASDMDLMLGSAARDWIQESIIDFKRLEIKESIGTGVFGMVHKGILHDQKMHNPQSVAVKTVNEDSRTQKNISSFLQEAIRMKGFKHRNVLTMIAITYNKDIPFVIMPFMEKGDLRSYLSDEENVFSLKELIGFGVQVAEGMSFLSEHNFVHRDLAARNCLIDKNDVVKIADFGLARDLQTDDYYVIQDLTTPLPVKWMALESITKKHFSVRSDIWSYAVVLWEILTRGQKPYPGLDNAQVIKYVKAGKRMPAPPRCPEAVYKLMLRCWSEESTRRPSFNQITNELNEILAKSKDKKKDKKKKKKGEGPAELHIEPLYYNMY